MGRDDAATFATIVYSKKIVFAAQCGRPKSRFDEIGVLIDVPVIKKADEVVLFCEGIPSASLLRPARWDHWSFSH